MKTRDASITVYRRTFAAMIIIITVFRLWLMRTLPLSGDESYHWEWSRNLAWGYHDHPGLTAYLIRVSTWLFGQSTHTSVRLPALVLLTATTFVVYALARQTAVRRGFPGQQAERAGFLAGIMMLITPVFAVFSVYISTDPPLIFFWSLTLLLTTRALERESWPAWIGVGLAAGLACQSKFLAFLLAPAVFLFMACSKPYRHWLRKPQPYVAALVALLVFLPFLIWNMMNGWPTFVFNFVSRHRHSFGYYHLVEFLLSQALALSPGVFVFCLMVLIRGPRTVWRRHGEHASLLLYTALVPLAYFLYVSLRRQIGAHWPAAAWIGAIVLVACEWARHPLYTAGAPLFSMPRMRNSAILLALLIISIAHVYVTIPEVFNRFEWQYAHRPRRINSRKYKELFGWEDLGQWVASARDEMLTFPSGSLTTGANAQGVFIMANQYGLCSNIAFYVPDQPRTHLWRRTQSAGENYRLWDNFGDLAGQDGILVSKSKPRLRAEKDRLNLHFEQVGDVEIIPIIRNGRHIRDFYAVRAFRFNGIGPEFSESSAGEALESSL